MTTSFVIQHHVGLGADHYDLMLERDGVLWTWQLERIPAPEAEPAPAIRIADHRMSYLTYEGPISRDRGRCRIVARGEVNWVIVEPRRILVELAGDEIAGRFELTLSAGEDDRWQIRGAR
ncbi:MAG: DNA polymerase ligase N-terminal domain-containing protein [Phycisphaerae bacterium]|nr:DNA polymerase ligase N-terminal domain-containing protein [Phycisphaerae bacterium]